MLSKKLIKDIQSLGLKKHRADSAFFVAEGPKIVEELMATAPGHIEAVYALRSWKSRNPDLSCEIITEEELERITQLKTANEVLAVMKKFSAAKPAYITGICIYLDHVQDPGNFGTIIRAADWFGVQYVVAGPGCADLYNPKVVQSTMASIARVKVWYDEDETFLKEQQIPILAATLNGESLYDSKKLDKCILLIGNESKGLSD